MAEKDEFSDSEDGKRSKRMCIPSSSKNEPAAIPASPPRFVSLEELMAAAKGMTNMSLAHEIAIDRDFKLEKTEPSENSIEKIVKETMHKAFWDVLQRELQNDPPRFTQALLLLEEVKSSLSGLLLPQHTRLKQQIEQILDIDLIKQQTEKGTLNFQEYAQFVISVMGKMCAPVRDSRIVELTQTKDIVPLFRGILETLDLMRVDMANFTIDIMRPQIVANSVAYEKQKFSDFLKLQTDGLARTREWLRKHLSAADEFPDNKKKKIDAVINHAYLDLVHWNPSELLPEVLTMDEARIRSCTEQLALLTRVGTLLLLTYSHAGPNLTSVADWKKKVKTTILALISPPDSHDVTAIATKLTTDIAEAAVKYGVPQPSTVGLVDAFQGAEDPEHKVKKLISTRILDFLMTAITSRTADRLQVPVGLSILQDELTKLAGNFLRMVSHNRAVFEEFYVPVIEELLAEPS